MASRPVVSYDDITLPYDAPEKPLPPQKKRKRSNTNSAPKKPPHHWDDPAADQDQEDMDDDDNDNEESRELTHEEIWDDSALINAWDAAMEEYDAFHGPDKGWKKEPVHKSPLWYNIPPKNLPKKPAHIGPQIPTDSQPINFDTFVPTHDPSLSGAADSAVAATEQDAQQAAYAMPLTSLPSVSQDEAFERAVQASYWSGYWTAVYHCHRQNQNINTEEQAEGDEVEDEEDEEFVSTQR
ncbi:hypothetical protein P691DRAFT_764119 [Macrolepiota fuliginosa MF-IS2]|uniref:Survival Motor Neuron Gemin2-binding domain-containing protein n=1 Tax=Macrolepiota fuliginosa MF-IS2 TaxID=1400762 RepID=A0A9P5X5A0_9AGAR|nr:hypothetical protein P691DRAFT_764119 [Macrolepiota fuliginosa MF-IS2]